MKIKIFRNHVHIYRFMYQFVLTNFVRYLIMQSAVKYINFRRKFGIDWKNPAKFGDSKYATKFQNRISRMERVALFFLPLLLAAATRYASRKMPQCCISSSTGFPSRKFWKSFRTSYGLRWDSFLIWVNRAE